MAPQRTTEQVVTYSLAEMERMYKDGLVTHDQLTAYLSLWNAYPGRFTVAEWRDGAIRNTPKKEGQS